MEDISDPSFPVPLTPNHLLTMKSKLVVPPPGEFVHEDLNVGGGGERNMYIFFSVGLSGISGIRRTSKLVMWFSTRTSKTIGISEYSVVLTEKKNGK